MSRSVAVAQKPKFVLGTKVLLQPHSHQIRCDDNASIIYFDSAFKGCPCIMTINAECMATPTYRVAE
eukprot:scaffold1582_cov174-Alexandrium_tamarense.AAC.3